MSGLWKIVIAVLCKFQSRKKIFKKCVLYERLGRVYLKQGFVYILYVQYDIALRVIIGLAVNVTILVVRVQL